MAKRRRLPAFALPLRKPGWDQLRFDGEGWSLRARREPHEEQALDRVQIALECAGWRWLRLQWAGAGWRRLWPRELHVLLRRKDFASQWPLIGAALTLNQGRAWLGR